MGPGLLSFAVFFILHNLVYRRLRQAKLLKWLEGLFVTVGALLVITGILTGFSGAETFMAFMIYALLTFIYIVAIDSIYESSIRIRLLREIAAAPAGLTRDEIRARYSSKVILQTRLMRLEAAGDIQKTPHGYKLARSAGLLLGFIGVVKFFRKIYGEPE